MKTQTLSDAQLRRRTILSFALFFLLLAGGYAAWRVLWKQQPSAAGTRPAFRAALQANEQLFQKTFGEQRLSKTFPVSAADKNVRVNGDAGMNTPLDVATFQLRVARGVGDTLRVSMDDIRALPKTEIVFDFKCIEGWSQVTHWGGVRFSDFVKHYGLEGAAGAAYAGLVTPDGEYYVGIDREAMMHPQTLLCYEMNDSPLPENQGAPLRLIIPVKYGIKHLKRVGVVHFSDSKPRDYWAERGYDYYAGL